MSYLQANLHTILNLRHEILNDAFVLGMGIRNALTQESESRIEFIQEIMGLLEGDNMEKMSLQFSLPKPQTSLALALPEPSPLDLDVLHQAVVRLEDPEANLVAEIRESLQILDRASLWIPTPGGLSPAIRGISSPETLGLNIGTLLEELGRLSAQAEGDAEKMDLLQQAIVPLAKKSFDPYGGAAKSL